MFFNVTAHAVCLRLDSHKGYVPIDQKSVQESTTGADVEEGDGDDDDDGCDLPGAFTMEGEVDKLGAIADADLGIVEEEEERLRSADEELAKMGEEVDDKDGEGQSTSDIFPLSSLDFSPK
jgi:hypothetical protein